MVYRWNFDHFGVLWHIQKTTFASMSLYFNDKLSLFLTEVSFETSEENHLSYFQKGYFFKILWWFHQPHNQVKCRQKNKIFSEVFTKWTIVLKTMTFLAGQSLVKLRSEIVVYELFEPRPSCFGPDQNLLWTDWVWT